MGRPNTRLECRPHAIAGTKKYSMILFSDVSIDILARNKCSLLTYTNYGLTSSY